MLPGLLGLRGLGEPLSLAVKGKAGNSPLCRKISSPSSSLEKKLGNVKSGVNKLCNPVVIGGDSFLQRPLAEKRETES